MCKNYIKKSKKEVKNKTCFSQNSYEFDARPYLIPQNQMNKMRSISKLQLHKTKGSLKYVKNILKKEKFKLCFTYSCFLQWHSVLVS